MNRVQLTLVPDFTVLVEKTVLLKNLLSVVMQIDLTVGFKINQHKCSAAIITANLFSSYFCL